MFHSFPIVSAIFHFASAFGNQISAGINSGNLVKATHSTGTRGNYFYKSFEVLKAPFFFTTCSWAGVVYCANPGRVETLIISVIKFLFAVINRKVVCAFKNISNTFCKKHRSPNEKIHSNMVKYNVDFYTGQTDSFLPVRLFSTQNIN